MTQINLSAQLYRYQSAVTPHLLHMLQPSCSHDIGATLHGVAIPAPGGSLVIALGAHFPCPLCVSTLTKWHICLVVPARTPCSILSLCRALLRDKRSGVLRGSAVSRWSLLLLKLFPLSVQLSYPSEAPSAALGAPQRDAPGGFGLKDLTIFLDSHSPPLNVILLQAAVRSSSFDRFLALAADGPQCPLTKIVTGRDHQYEMIRERAERQSMIPAVETSLEHFRQKD